MRYSLSTLLVRHLEVLVCAAVLFGCASVDAERWQGLRGPSSVAMTYDLFTVGLVVVALVLRKAFVSVLAYSIISCACSLVFTLRLVQPQPIFLSATELAALTVLLIFVLSSETLPRAVVGCSVSIIAIVLLVLRGPVTFAPRDLFAIVPALGFIILLGISLRIWLAARQQAVANALESERLAIARDLHDSSARALTGIIVQVQALRQIADSNPRAVRTALPEIEDAGILALKDMRKLTETLRQGSSHQLSESTWFENIETCCERAKHLGLPIVSHVDTSRELRADIEVLVCAIVSEGLINALRYASDATLVEVSVSTERHGVAVRITDDGHGGSTEYFGGGNGLIGLHERIQEVGGSMEAGPRTTGWRLSAFLPDRFRG